MPFDPLDFKRHVPIFKDELQQDLIYLDNAATTQTPTRVVEAITDFYHSKNANANRASHALGLAASEILAITRSKLAHSISAQTDEIIFCRGATEGLNLVAQSIAALLQPGGTIILSQAEHHANLLPWQRLAQQQGHELLFLPNDADNCPDIGALEDLLDSRTRVVALTLASNVLGCRLPLEDVLPALSDHPCITVVDAAQATAHETVDIQKLQCDFLVASAHKCYGPFGVGFVYGRKALLEQLPPWQLGGEMITQVTNRDFEVAPVPTRFEAGTLPLADIAGFGAALDFLAGFDRAAISTHEQQLAGFLHTGIRELGFPVISPSTNNIGIVTFTCNEEQAHTSKPLPGSLADLALWLNEHNIAVRTGFHCAQPLYASLGIQGGLRLSVAGYTTQQDCERVLETIQAWVTECSNHTISGTATKTDMSLLQQLHGEKSSQSRYKLLLKAGQNSPRIPDIQSSDNQVAGCEAKTWLQHTQNQGLHYFQIDSESKIIRGLGHLLIAWLSGQSAAYIRDFDQDQHLEKLGLKGSLSASRALGFRALIQKAKELASDR